MISRILYTGLICFLGLLLCGQSGRLNTIAAGANGLDSTEVEQISASQAQIAQNNAIDFAEGLNIVTVRNASDVLGASYVEGTLINVASTGGQYVTGLDSVSGYPIDTNAVVPLANGYAVLQDDGGVIKVEWFGAKDVVPFARQRQNENITWTPGPTDHSDEAFCAALRYAGAFIKNNPSGPEGSPSKRVTYEGQYYIKDSTLVIPPGVEFWAIGPSFAVTTKLDSFVYIDGHYGTNHRPKIARAENFTGSTFDGVEWHPKNGSEFARDSTSVGIIIRNSRRVKLDFLESSRFNKPIYIVGDGAGTTEIEIKFPIVWDGRWGVFIEGINGGFANSGSITGGLVKTHGTADRTRVDGNGDFLDIPCGLFYFGPGVNNWTVSNVNTEGTTALKYLAYFGLNATYNVLKNCRLEGTKAGQLYYDGGNIGCRIEGGSNQIYLGQLSTLPFYFNPVDNSAILNGSGDPVLGPILDGFGAKDVYISWGGSMRIPGAQGAITPDDGVNATLSLGTSQSSTGVNILEHRIRNDLTWRFTAFGEFEHFGWSNQNNYGLSPIQELVERGFNLATDATSYVQDQYYSINEVILDNSIYYRVRFPFQASGTIADDVTAGYLQADRGRNNPTFRLDRFGNTELTSLKLKQPSNVNRLVYIGPDSTYTILDDIEVQQLGTAWRFRLRDNGVEKTRFGSTGKNYFTGDFGKFNSTIGVIPTGFTNYFEGKFLVRASTSDGSLLIQDNTGTVDVLKVNSAGSTSAVLIETKATGPGLTITNNGQGANYFQTTNSGEIIHGQYGTSSKTAASLGKTLTDYQPHYADDGTVTNELRYKSGTASPVGTVTPDYIGQEYLGTNGPTWWKSTGTTNTDWVQLN